MGILAHAFVASSARRATTETEGNMRAIKKLELLSEYPYGMVTTNFFPVERVEDSEGNLVYEIITTISADTVPTHHKKVTIDYTWCEGAINRQIRYYFIKPE